MSKQRAFMDDIAKKLNITDINDWYKITHSPLVKHGCFTLLSKYKHSIPALLKAVYPEHQWDKLRFSRIPPEYWGSLENQRTFMETLAKKLNVNTHEDWYKVSTWKLMRSGGSRILHRYHNSYPKLLATLYPEYLIASGIGLHVSDLTGILQDSINFHDVGIV